MTSLGCRVASVSMVGLWVGLLVALGAGCGLGEDDPTEAEFCQSKAKAECSGVAPLCSLSETSGCEAKRQKACLDRGAQLKDGKHMFRPGRVDACVGKVRELYATPVITRELWAASELACARVYEGTAIAGEACVADYDCVAPLTCDPGRKVCAERKVVPPKASCNTAGEVCSPGEFCSPASTPSGVLVYVCLARTAAGAMCSPAAPCLETLRCSGTPGVCEARLPLAAACTSDDACASGFCDPFAAICVTRLQFAFGSASCAPFAAPGVDAGL